MPDTKDKVARQDAAMQRIANALGVTMRDLRGDAPGDPALARVLTLEQIADHSERVTGAKATGELRDAINSANDAALIDLPGYGEKTIGDLRAWAKGAKETQEMPPVTVETVKEAPMQTTETVQVVDAVEAPAVSTGKAKG